MHFACVGTKVSSPRSEKQLFGNAKHYIHIFFILENNSLYKLEVSYKSIGNQMERNF